MIPLLSEVYAALEPLLRAPEIKNLENKFADTFGFEGIKDARSDLQVRILTNSTLFWNANSRPAWVYQAYRNLLRDKLDYKTKRDPKLLQKKKDRLQDEARLLQQRAIENKENLDEKIDKAKEKLRLLVELENEIVAGLSKTSSIPEVGCATHCLEKLVTTDPKRYALFVAKVLDHTPDQIEQVLRGILKSQYNPFEGIGLMLNKFRTAHADIAKPSTKEAQVAELLAEVFDYASGGSVNTSITHIRTGLQDCVIGCEEKER